MQWEPTLVEHDSKFSEKVTDSVKTAVMRVMPPKTYSSHSLMDLFIMENFEIVCLHTWERSWVDNT